MRKVTIVADTIIDVAETIHVDMIVLHQIVTTTIVVDPDS